MDDTEKLADIIDDRTARIGESKLRRTPSDQLTVRELVFVGDIINTSYSTGGKVISILKCKVYGLTVYTITYVDLDAKPNKDGSYRENLLNWINELVAQDNRILKLFETNDDEVFVSKERKGQQSLLRY